MKRRQLSIELWITSKRANVEDVNKKRKLDTDLVFLLFTAASCSGLCSGCDLCHPEEYV